MLNIALTHSSFSEFGGAEQVIIHQIKGLERLGHKITCFASISSKDDLPELQIKCYGTELPSPFGHMLFNLSLNIMTVPKIADKLKEYDVVLSHHHPGPLIAHKVKKEFGKPYVAYIHHLPLFLYPLADSDKTTLKWAHDESRFAIELLSKSPGINQWLKTIDMRSIEHADAVLTNSHYVARQIRALYHREAQICRPGVDTSSFRALADDPRIEAFKREHRLGDNVMLIVARMTPQKKFDWALEILRSVKKEVKDAQLLIKTPNFMCNKWLGALSRSRLSFESNDSVRCVTKLNRRDMPLLYNSAKVYVCTTVREAFGISPIEAMACGLPIVAWADNSGPSEYVLNGRNGFLCPPYDLQDFAEKVTNMLLNKQKAKRMGEEAKEYVSKNFNWDYHIQALNSILCSV